MYFVYIIRSGRKGPYKIGVAKDVEKRMSELQIGNPVELIIVAKFDFKTQMRAYEMEKQLHKKFRRQRIRGEWFKGHIKLNRADLLFGTDFKEQTVNTLRRIDNDAFNEINDIETIASIPERF